MSQACVARQQKANLSNRTYLRLFNFTVFLLFSTRFLYSVRLNSACLKMWRCYRPIEKTNGDITTSCLQHPKMHVCIGRTVRIANFTGPLVILKFCDHIKWKEMGGGVVNLLFAKSIIKDALLLIQFLKISCCISSKVLFMMCILSLLHLLLYWRTCLSFIFLFYEVWPPKFLYKQTFLRVKGRC